MESLSELRRELTLLVISRYPLVVVESPEEEKVEELVAAVASDLSLPFLLWSSASGLVRHETGRLADTEDPERALARLAGMHGEVIALFHDLHPWLERPEVARRVREVERAFADRRSTLILSGIAIDLPASLGSHAARLTLSLPAQEELERIVREVAAEVSTQRRVTVDLSAEEVERAGRALLGLHRDEARRLLYQAAFEDGRLAADDLSSLLDGKRQRVKGTGILEWIEPLGGLEALGGANQLKAWIGRRKDAFSDAARRFGLDPPKGLLLTGVPGTGKSLACRALAGEWHLPLLALDPGRLFDKFIGETESNLRRALATAETLAPAILWIDEVEKALASAESSTDGGLSQRIRGTLLTWMQERPAPVFLMATANDVEKLPVELLRRGRFDEVFFFDLPEPAERGRIFAIHLERRERDPESFDLDALASASEGFSGAEIEGVVAAALYHAFSERTRLTTEILLDEIAATRPLSRMRPDQIAAIRAWGKEHARPA